MLWFLFAGVLADELCAVFYKQCQPCVNQYASHGCAWNPQQSKCIDWESASEEEKQASLYGPSSDCDSLTPVSPTPGPEPTEAPTPLPDICSTTYNTNCEECSLHYADRDCGWCDDGTGCMSGAEGKEKCAVTKFYYADNAKCGEPIPEPVTPWPRYDANPTFCMKMSDDWCEKCVSTQPNMSCGWCHSTKECIMGDEKGPFFGSCEKWSSEVDDKCLGRLSKKSRTVVRVVVGVAVSIIGALCVFGCVKVIREKPSESYDNLDAK